MEMLGFSERLVCSQVVAFFGTQPSQPEGEGQIQKRMDPNLGDKNSSQNSRDFREFSKNSLAKTSSQEAEQSSLSLKKKQLSFEISLFLEFLTRRKVKRKKSAQKITSKVFTSKTPRKKNLRLRSC